MHVKYSVIACFVYCKSVAVHSKHKTIELTTFLSYIVMLGYLNIQTFYLLNIHMTKFIYSSLFKFKLFKCSNRSGNIETKSNVKNLTVLQFETIVILDINRFRISYSQTETIIIMHVQNRNRQQSGLSFPRFNVETLVKLCISSKAVIELCINL